MKFNINGSDIFIAIVIIVALGFGSYGALRFFDSFEIEQSDYKQISAEMHKAKLSDDTAIINAILEATEDKVITVREYGHIKQVIYNNYLDKKSNKARLLKQVEIERTQQEQK